MQTRLALRLPPDPQCLYLAIALRPSARAHFALSNGKLASIVIARWSQCGAGGSVPTLNMTTNSQLDSPGGVRQIEGTLAVAADSRFAIVASRFNSFIVERLIEGAMDALLRHGAVRDQLTVVRVPGSWEIPLVAQRLARGGRVNAVVALAAVIRGGTPHFDYVAAEVSKGVAAASLDTQVPISFGILTTDSIEQAIERAGAKAGNKGFDAAVAAIEMVSLGAALDSAGL